MFELLSTNPARYFGLYPRKGTIAVGSDADLVVFDLERKVTISAARHHSKSDYNLFEGTEVTGAPEVVRLRGRVLVEVDELVAQPGFGKFIHRARFGENCVVRLRRMCASGFCDGPRPEREGETPMTHPNIAGRERARRAILHHLRDGDWHARREMGEVLKDEVGKDWLYGLIKKQEKIEHQRMGDRVYWRLPKRNV